MAFTQTRLAGPTFVTATANSTTAPGSANYTVGVGTTTIVKQIMLTNQNASTQLVTVWMKPSSASIASSHIILHSLTLTANETALVNLALVMDVGDALYLRTGTASAVTVTISGIEES
jgi:hypothetical protein